MKERQFATFALCVDCRKVKRKGRKREERKGREKFFLDNGETTNNKNNCSCTHRYIIRIKLKFAFRIISE